MKTIFVVDDNNINLLSADETLSMYYQVFTLGSASGMFELLIDVKPDLILLDILMPEMDGFKALKLLKSDNRYTDIPVIFLTSRNDPATESMGFELGAVDFVSKPFSKPVLLNRIKTHLDIEDKIHERSNRLKRLKNSIVSVLADMVENRDRITGSHIERTTRYIKLLLNAMLERGIYTEEISQWNLDAVISSASLHDIGKIVIVDSILDKPGKLDSQEFDMMKTHVVEGEKIIDRIMIESGDKTFLQYAKLFAGYHHERWDGTGYPYGLKGEEIPLQGRIMAIADVYDALVSERPYKKAFPHKEAVEIIKNSSGTHFDPELVIIFLAYEKEFDKARIN
ncbi:MAG: response regulator [Treponema sp.]|nr:response regulator [Treponema sp.]